MPWPESKTSEAHGNKILELINIICKQSTVAIVVISAADLTKML